ncbi:uncharacterized protein DS421_7g216240 [Arachis hypogaea]|nr:uncharacterized protein DS421_7g216240 [Arachis hypogaea]
MRLSICGPRTYIEKKINISWKMKPFQFHYTYISKKSYQKYLFHGNDNIKTLCNSFSKYYRTFDARIISLDQHYLDFQ